MSHDAGHTHGPTHLFVTGCPLCDAAKAVRDRALAHLGEALLLLSKIQPVDPSEDPRPTIRLNLAPIGLTGDDHGNCYGADLTAKQAEELADAVDLLSAYRMSELPIPYLPADTVDVTVDPVLVDELEQHCLGMDADFLMDIAAQDPNSAVAAFDEIFEYASQDQIMREDGGER
ncbi:hypothetical protein ACIQUW_33460 [Streptomyces sp. NPDC101117]|uniref:hypothetical protein n=1 Tax=Streptomyces sp. NPDC101117 TaxID=3366108 RepID=UPI0037F727F1